MTDYIKLVQDDQKVIGPDLQHLVVGHVHELRMAVMVGATRGRRGDGGKAAGLRAARLHAIKQDIARNIDRADLSVATIAARHSCTPRFIQRLFESRKHHFYRLCAGAQRLARAYRLLTDPRRAGDKISSIAFDAGFAERLLLQSRLPPLLW